MGLDDIAAQAQSLLGDSKVQDALKSQQAEDISDKLLDGVAGAVQDATGHKFDEQIEGAKATADKQVGTE